jgi:hypothetical protein
MRPMPARLAPTHTRHGSGVNTRAVAQPIVRLRPLTLVDDDGEFVVGDPETGTFISVPSVGVVVIRALQQGASLTDATAAAELHAGEPVDIGSFLQALDEVGFIVGDDTAEKAASSPEVRRSAPIQQRRWMVGPNLRLARLLFSRVAWIAYGGAFLFSAACFVLRPSLLPRPHDAFVSGEPGPSILSVIPIAYALTALHEYWHWLAARAVGVSARFGIDRRLCFLVFETDLSQLWMLPRRKRYGPQLAGLAIDAVVLALLVSLRLLLQTRQAAPPVFDNVAAALVLVMVMGMTWQCMIFLRTDLYGVLVTWAGCYNLWEVKNLLLRRAFGRLPQENASQLDDAHPRDITVGRWFRWAYLLGIPVALGYYAAFSMPILVTTGRWAIEGIATSPAHPQFWTTLVTSIAVYSSPLLVVAIWCREHLRRIRTGRARRQQASS